MIPVDEVYKLVSGVKINLSGVRENVFDSLKEILASARGNVPIYLHLDTPAKSKVQVIVCDGLYVSPSEKLIQDIENLLGEERLSLVL